MTMRQFSMAMTFILLSGCGGQPPAEKAILGDWVQDVPTSTSDNGIEVTTFNTTLDFDKNGDVSLRRDLLFASPRLPSDGVGMDVALTGRWRIEGQVLIQTLSSASVTAHRDDVMSRQMAKDLEAQAVEMSENRKMIIALDRQRLILQDQDTGETDSYRRK